MTAQLSDKITSENGVYEYRFADHRESFLEPAYTEQRIYAQLLGNTFDESRAAFDPRRRETDRVRPSRAHRQEGLRNGK
jgi:hypothetical protein